jgi:transcriptional regulator with XRE-family HTH domain
MNQAQLAELLQISASAVGMYEQGRREPSAQMLLALARAFGVSVDFLLTGKPPEQDTNQLRRMLLDRLEAADSRLEQRKSRPFSREELAVLMAAMLLEG